MPIGIFKNLERIISSLMRILDKLITSTRPSEDVGPSTTRTCGMLVGLYKGEQSVTQLESFLYLKRSHDVQLSGFASQLPQVTLHLRQVSPAR